MSKALALIACAAVLALTVPADAQRRVGNPFGDFHKKAELAIGKPAPALHLQDDAGKEVNLRDYLGRWVFIEFGSYT
ncbi:MAG: hypothetical protein H6841_00660 [Planctomycetes bacterium]|nr:hypothetical protein [Planctomycetota bacterium]